ncbi:FAD-dependent oxidoreductase [Candidatus Woesearchaeota archaeon]|nr:FAD-dependent oxidoreductase [Candidatus Woesearchaeota archaeon]
MREYSVDAVVFGGGVAGLWTLNALDLAGYSAVLVERSALGDGQTIQSQGIIHGGVKYALPGKMMQNFIEEAAMMPQRWRDHLAGKQQPDLSSVVQNSRECHLWISKKEGISGLLGNWLSSAGVTMLNTKPEPVPLCDAPPLLQGAHAIYKVAEPVIDTASLLRALAAPHCARIVYDNAVEFSHTGLDAVHLNTAGITLRPKFLVLAAGKGNAELASRAGINGEVMQTRPLHQLLAYGSLPVLYAHCIDGCVRDGRPDHTITTHNAQQGRVWNIGGRIAEGESPREERIERGLARLQQAYPVLDFSRIVLDEFVAIRAEPPASSSFGKVHVSSHGNVILAYPMKLAMAPVLGDLVVKHARQITQPSHSKVALETAAARIAKYPWE